jgi:uncharacterized protein
VTSRQPAGHRDVTVFVDTWGWIALGYRQETRHSDVKVLYQRLRRERVAVYTSDYVIDELVTLLYRREDYDTATRFVEAVLGAESLGHLAIERITPDRFAAAWQLRKRFRDKPRVSFTDLTSMVIMEERRIRQVLTDDDHFLHVGMGFSKLPA